MIDNSSADWRTLFDGKFIYKHSIDKTMSEKGIITRIESTNKSVKDHYIKGGMRPIKLKRVKSNGELILY